MKISKNFDTGRKVKNVNELYDIALARGSVWHRAMGLKAARVYCNLQLWTLRREVDAGKFYRTVKRK